MTAAGLGSKVGWAETIRNVLAAVLVFVSGTAVVSAASAASGQSAAAGSSLAWGRCPAGVHSSARTAAGRVVALECATLRVPLDYRRPAGRAITIAISRLRSTEPHGRRGVLLLNPGGPGGAGLWFPPGNGQVPPQGPLRAPYLICFRSRGGWRGPPGARRRHLSPALAGASA